MEIHKGDAIAALGTVIGADDDKVQIHIHGMEIRSGETGNILVVPQQILKLLERSSVQGDEVILKDGREGIFYSALNENVVIVLLNGHNEKDPESYVNVDHNFIRCKNQEGAYKFVPAKREMPGSELVEDILKQFEQAKPAIADQTNEEKKDSHDKDHAEADSSEIEERDGEPQAEIARISAHNGMEVPTDFVKIENPIADAITVEMPAESERFILRSSAVTEEYHEDTAYEGKETDDDVTGQNDSPAEALLEEDSAQDDQLDDAAQSESANDWEHATEGHVSESVEISNHEENEDQDAGIKAEEQKEDPERIAKLKEMRESILKDIQEQNEKEENPASSQDTANDEEDILASIQKLS